MTTKRSFVSSKGAAPISYRKSASSFLILVSRFVSPVIMLVVLFSVVYGTYVSQVTKSLALTSAAVAAGMRASCGRQAMVDLHKLEYLTTDAQYITNSYFHTMRYIDCVRSHVRLLGYGTVDPNIAGMPYVNSIGSWIYRYHKIL